MLLTFTGHYIYQFFFITFNLLINAHFSIQFLFAFKIWIILFALRMDRYGFSSLRTQADAKVMSDTVMNAISKNDQFLKTKAQEILSEMHQQLQQKNTSPLAKTMILHVLKELTYLCHIKFFTVLMSHKLNAYLYEQALKIDPKKSINEKGLNLFPDQPKLGNQYMVLLSELLHFWGQKFGKTGKNSEPTRYKKNLTQLRQKGVVLSSNYSILDTSQIKQKMKSSAPPPPQGMNEFNSTPTGAGGTGVGGTGGKLYNTLKYFYNKIDLYVNSFEDEERLQVLMGNIQKNHDNFNKQWNQLKKRADQAQQDDQALNLYFGLMQFVDQQNKFYSDYIPLSDVKSYETEIKILFQKLFENIKKDDKNMPPEENRLLGNQNGKQMKTKSNPSNSQNPPNSSSSSGLDVMGLINNFYSKVQERSKSPGFKGIQKQLQKQKQTIKKSPMRATRSPRNRSEVGGLNKSNASSFKQGKIPAIFTSPPNLRVRDKAYEGETLFQNKQLSRIHYNIKKEQGSRRFKVSNFRQKNSLFENEQIQVGFKSLAVYEQINQFNHFIMLNLFIGNRTSQGIKQCQVEYKGDNNQLLYANPKTVDSIIPAGYQSKHDLMITPIKIPFNFMVMHISYKFRESGYMVSVVLPNSVLKFASYMKISRQQFEKNWQSSRKFKTNQFRLCRYLSPDSFNKWIPVLQNITKYSQFAREGSETDLQLFCSVIMLQQYEAVLKINVRPNLEVVLQLGVLDNSPEGLEYFKFYLQTLELIMKQIDI